MRKLIMTLSQQHFTMFDYAACDYLWALWANNPVCPAWRLLIIANNPQGSLGGQ